VTKKGKKRKEEQEVITSTEGEEEVRTEATEAEAAETTPEAAPSATEVSAEEEQKAEKAEEEDEIAVLRRQLAEAEAKAAEYLDGWQRARAEFANYKRRNDQEKNELIKVANAALITRLLPALDDFERAFQTLPPGLSSLTWIDGIFLIYRKLLAILEAEGLTPIETQGQVFDPSVHEAVTHEPSTEYEEGHIIGEVQKGYKLGDRVLRPSLVRVSAGAPAPEEQKEGEKEVVTEETEA